MADEQRLTVWVSGQVQGVGLRWWVRNKAGELGLRGSASNLDDGRVEVIVEGAGANCERFLAALRAPGPPGRPAGITERWAQAGGGTLRGFEMK